MKYSDQQRIEKMRETTEKLLRYVDHGVGQSFFNSSRNEGKTSNMIAQMTVQFVSS